MSIEDLEATKYKNWKPNPENINRLPEPVRLYVAELETMCDPTYMVQHIAALTESVEGLTALISALKQDNKDMGDVYSGLFDAICDLTRVMREHMP